MHREPAARASLGQSNATRPWNLPVLLLDILQDQLAALAWTARQSTPAFPSADTADPSSWHIPSHRPHSQGTGKGQHCLRSASALTNSYSCLSPKNHIQTLVKLIKDSREVNKTLNQFMIKGTAKCRARLLGPVRLGWFLLHSVSHSFCYTI